MPDPNIGPIQSTLCIPGPWHGREGFERACEEEGLAVQYTHLRDLKTAACLQFSLLPPKPQYGDTFRDLSGGLMCEEEVERVRQHASLLVLFGEGGSTDRLRPLIDFSLRCLRQGGIAVMVESAGKAHSAREWRELLTDPAPTAYVQAFVTMAGDEEAGATYSCGMHNLGLRDAVVKGVHPAEALELLSRFNAYQATDRPTLRDGDVMKLSGGPRRFAIRPAPCTHFDPEHHLHNPLGTWVLEPSAGATP